MIIEWLPISTAPKDGTRIITCYRGVSVTVNHYNDPSRSAPGHALGSKGWWCSRPDQQPTHWFPIPSFTDEVSV